VRFEIGLGVVLSCLVSFLELISSIGMNTAEGVEDLFIIDVSF